MLYLHIGRGKSGSSTIQELASAGAGFLAEHGVVGPPNVHASGNHVDLPRALQDPSRDQAPITDLLACLRDERHRAVFASTEFLYSLDLQSLARLKSRLEGTQTRIIAYIRPYPAWMVSLYSQRVRKAIFLGSFDRFFEEYAPTMSALPGLRSWAEVFGWENIRVRGLQKQALHGADLLSDVCHVMGIDATPPTLVDRNVSPSWWELELLRESLAATRDQNAAEASPRERRRLQLLLNRLALRFGEARDVQYISRAQWRLAAEMYNADLAELRQLTDCDFVDAPLDTEERKFEPVLERLKTPVRKTFVREIVKLSRRSAISDETVTNLQSIPALSFWADFQDLPVTPRS